MDEINMSLVSFVKIEKKDQYLKQAILDSLNLINYKFPSNLENVVIKPNMCYYWDYSTGQTTDPYFVAALIDLIRDEISPNANISIVESDASAMKCKYAFRMLGYEKLAQDYTVKLVNLSEDKSDTQTVMVRDQSFQLEVPQIIQNADLRINLPKIKYSMEPIKLTCALKNIFGCNPYPKKFKYHSNLGEAIVAINKAMKFDICIIDANIVSGIQPRRMGLVMASRDPVAIDTAAAEIAGINPRTIKYLQLAKKEGLGSTSFIQKGARISDFDAEYPKNNLKKALLSTAYRLALRMGLGKRLGVE